MSVYRTIGPLARGGGALPGKQCTEHSLVSSVPMRETMRKGTFFQEGQCAALTSFRVGKMSFL